MDPKDQLAGVAIGLGLGFIQKHWFNGSKWYRPTIPNQLIPYINTTIGTALGVVVPGVDPISGAIAGMASVGGHQLVKPPAVAIAKRL